MLEQVLIVLLCSLGLIIFCKILLLIEESNTVKRKIKTNEYLLKGYVSIELVAKEMEMKPEELREEVVKWNNLLECNHIDYDGEDQINGHFLVFLVRHSRKINEEVLSEILYEAYNYECEFL